MKRIVTLFLFALMLMGTTAHAYFENLQSYVALRQSVNGAFLQTGKGEMGVDFLDQSVSFDHTQPFSWVYGAQAILDATQATTWSQVRFGAFSAKFDSEFEQRQFVALNSPSPITTPIWDSSFGSMTQALNGWRRAAGGGSTAIVRATDFNSYAKALDNFSGGAHAGFVNTNMAVANLAALDAGQTVTMKIYGWFTEYKEATEEIFYRPFPGGQPGNYLGTLELSLASGNMNVDYTPVPVPAAIWVLGSGLMGLLGFRRRFAA